MRLGTLTSGGEDTLVKTRPFSTHSVLPTTPCLRPGFRAASEGGKPRLDLRVLRFVFEVLELSVQ